MELVERRRTGQPIYYPSRADDKLAEAAIADKVNLNKLTADLRPPLNNRDLIHSLARLVYELRGRLVTFETILSDDISARPVSLMIQDLSRRERLAAGLRTPSVSFIIGGKSHFYKAQTREAVSNFIAHSASKFGRSLLVTEHIHSGKSVDSLAKSLEDHGYNNFYIASVTVRMDPETVNPLNDHPWYKNRVVKRLFYGNINPSTDNVLHSLKDEEKELATGVSKKSPTGAHPHKSDNFDPGRVREMRRDIHLLAENLAPLLH